MQCVGHVTFTYGGKTYHRRNVTCFRSADILAKIMSGASGWVPSHIGFLYGPSAEITPMPNPESTRDHTWASLAAALLEIGGNMLISPIAFRSVQSTDADTYLHNKVLLSAVSDGDSPRAFSADAGYAAAAPVAGDDTYYQAVLLARETLPGGTYSYTPYALVQLADGTDGLEVLDGRELHHSWELVFS